MGNLLRKLNFCFLEALGSWKRHTKVELNVAGGILLLTLLTGGAFVGILNLDKLCNKMKSSIQLIAFLEPEVNGVALRGQIDLKERLIEDILKSGNVARVEYVSPVEAMKRFQSEPRMRKFVEVLGTNPFPASLRIRLAGKKIEDWQMGKGQIIQLATYIKNLKGVSELRYDEAATSRILNLTLVLRGFSRLMLIVWALFSLLVCSTISWLAAREYKEEVAHMRFEGASTALIRFILVLRGFLRGALAGLITAGLLGASAHLLQVRAQFLSLEGLGFVVLVGLVLGIYGALFSGKVKR